MLTTFARMDMTAVTLVMSAAQIYLFMHLSQMRYDLAKSRIAAIGLWAFESCACILLCFTFDIYRETLISLLTLTLPSIVFFLIISKYRGIKFIVTYCISDISIACVDLFCYLINLILFNGNTLSDMTIRCIGMIIWTVAIVIHTKDRYSKALDMLNKGWGVMMLVGIGMYVMLVMLSAYPTEIKHRPEDMPVTMFMLLMMELMLIVVIKVIYSSLEIQERRLSECETNIQLAMAQQQYRILSDNMEHIREIKHDMKHHLLMMSQMLQDRKTGELQDYIDTIIKNTDMKIKPYGDNYTISVLATHYKEVCEKNNICFECNTQVPGEMKLSAASLTVILGNMWQNAYEACRELPINKRYINTDILYKEGHLILKCENSFSGCLNPDDENETLKSTKGENRGHGLASISRLAQQHDGHCYFEHNENKFTLTVILMEEREKGCTI